MALLLAGGCDAGLKKYPVRGVVRFSDGKLLRQGSIEFELINSQEAYLARGEIQPDGSFVLGTEELDDGAVAGKFRAVVISNHVIGNSYERPGLIPTSKLHPKYAEFRTSGLEFDVEPKDNVIIIEVEYAPEPEQEGDPS